MRQRSTQRRGTLVKRFLQIIASLALATVGWFLLGESEELTAAETESSSTHSEGVENVVARFDDVAVTEDEVMTAAAPELVELERQRRELISKTARQVVHQRLIAAEAESRGVTSQELIDSEGYEELAARLEREYQVEYLTELGTFAMGGPPASADADS